MNESENDALDLQVKLERQKRRSKREREARKTAEKLLEKRSLELYNSNKKLHDLAKYLQFQVDEKTKHLEIALDEAKSSGVLKSQFIATISHEIRTPLNAIIGFSDRLSSKSQISDINKEKYTKNISTASNQLLGLINDVLDFEKIASGKLDIDYTQLNLRQIIDGVVDTVSLLAESHNTNISLKLCHKIPELIVSDPLRLQQIFYNLLSNALKFSKNDFVAISCQLSDEDESVIEVKVCDQGIGMSEEQLERLFSPFTQADGSMARNFGGSGLGLSITKSLVELMGGNIWANSVMGQGSEFHFTFRYNEQSSNSSHVFDTEDIDFSCIQNTKVLLVDDQMLNQELGKELLEDVGVKVELAYDGLEAIEKAVSNDYDLVLMDLQMPECDGLAASREILYHKPKLKIIALTANSTADIRQQCQSIGMCDFLCKPFISKTLYSVVAKNLLLDSNPNLH